MCCSTCIGAVRSQWMRCNSSEVPYSAAIALAQLQDGLFADISRVCRYGIRTNISHTLPDTTISEESEIPQCCYYAYAILAFIIFAVA